MNIYEQGVLALANATGLDFQEGFDITAPSPPVAKVALDLTEKVWTFGEGGFRFRDGSGPSLAASPAGDLLSLTGGLAVSGAAAIGSGAVVDAAGRQALRVQHNTGDVDIYNHGAGAYIAPIVNTSTQGFAYGLTGAVEYTGAAAGSWVAALVFQSIQNGANLNWLHGVIVELRSQSGKGAIAQSTGFGATPVFSGNKPVTYKAFYGKGHAGMQTAYGLHLEDLTGTTIRLLELGPATPYLRLVGGAAPGAGLTNLYLREQNTLRRVQTKDGASIGAGDRVVVLV